jgi:hypothetical protein
LRPPNYMQEFLDVVDDCNLTDLGFVGHKFTWKRGKMRARLVSALANDGWNDKFGGAIVEHLDFMLLSAGLRLMNFTLFIH